MAKYNAVLGDERREPKRGSRSSWIVLLVLLVLVAPVAYEGGLMIYGQWQDMIGTHFEVRTPVLDGIQKAWCTAGDELRYRTPYSLRANFWTPSVAIPGVIVIAALASLLLRRS